MFFTMIQKPAKLIKHPDLAWQFYVNNTFKVLYGKITGKNWCLDKAKKTGSSINRRFINNDTYNEEIKLKLLQNEPFFSCRYGATELVSCFLRELLEGGLIEQLPENQIRRIKSSSGVFPETQNMFLIFGEKYCDALKKADYNAYWGSLIMEEYMLKKYCPGETTLFAMRAMEPFQYEQPWTMSLKGKKVLAVHPFAELIEQQYEKRHELFDNPLILPDFDLVTVKSIQSSGSTVPEEYTDWVDALDSLYAMCAEKDYEVALLACGSYAVPLGARLKADGKKVIVLGGMMQLMFGIKGARWEQSRPDIVALYNDSWVRASGNMKVKDAEKMVDGAAYW